ncbi:MAG: Crp/Fnr family transcriptional regulator [Bacteroidota bacterium]
MKAEYLNIIPTYNILEDNDIALASNLFELRSNKKNDCIVKPGSNSQNVYFILSGLVYSQSIDEKINWYEFEGQSFADIESLFFNKKCEQYLRCAEDSKLIFISKTNLLQLVKTNHNWSVWYTYFLEEIIQRLYYYYQSLLVKDSSKRYSELIELHPEILQRIPLGHIASYLGISQVSLSRIRAGKQKKKD